jgi:ectoine hydroxylase-related dioxygenase (phytanoyl-CoA dioxygenase family)
MISRLQQDQQQQQQFLEQGYILLADGLNHQAMQALENSNQRMYQQAENILAQVAKSKQPLPEYYREAVNELIVVPEKEDPRKVCRYEYLRASNSYIADQLVPLLQQHIESLSGEKFVLFKDKCNAKNPGGGAFEPHQDVIAYDKFAPNYHITVAIFLDQSTLKNGCLHFPLNYRDDLRGLDLKNVTTRAGILPVLPSEKSAEKNGNICQQVTELINWQALEAKPGDIVIFDSYVPHFSFENNSKYPRRAMFFTFNAAADGDYYEQYYQMKHREFDNPAFHIATPTSHSEVV